MLTLSSLLLALSVLAAIVALLRTRAAVKRLERLSESYWELRYESGQVKSRVTRLEVATGLRDPEPEPDVPRAASRPTFVPLSSLKK